MMRHLTGWALFATVFAAACAPAPDAAEEQAATEKSAIVDGTPEGVGLLAFLNAAETTLTVLDDDVPLDKRAAENLIAHRDGPDGVFGTADDDLFDDVAEVDDVDWVGPAALDKMLAYATAHGYVPTGGDVLGVFDNVAFTVDEAEATLALVNTATFEVLDVDVALDKRAVESIFAAREIESLLELAGLYYVGQTAMLKLRDYPKTLGGTAQHGDPCTAHGDCQSGLCGGITIFEEGICLESWMAGTFSSSQVVAIPDGGPATTSTIDVSGLASVPMDVMVTLDIDHPRKQDLVVFLHQPGGAGGTLWNNEANPPSFFEVAPGIEGDNMVNGPWILEVTDTVTGETGTINGWSMWITSRWD